ncbi:MAG: DapH/DapD/GlmU-related protein, partial [Candidatus Thermoplasmatota archaeon]|nr:DapH/DapD/GlmU-related protein [Candidatus Thermoplasmatota archaeon]
SPVEIIPKIANDAPVWNILDSDSTDSLKQQMLKLTQANLDLIVKEKLPKTTTFDESKGPVMIEDGAVIEPSTHFIGPCFVGKNATIKHGAYIRENAWICSHALVGHCSEVKHSILLPYSKAPHFNYVGDSILGKLVNLGAGVKLSNLRNDGTEVYLTIDKSRIGSGLRKFGAILGEGCQLGCNAVTNPGTVLGINSVVWPNVTVTGVHGQSSTHR